MVKIEVDTSEMSDFFAKCKQAGSGELKKEFELFLEGIGMEFLRIIQDEIISKNMVVTRLLLSSFQKGEKENVWEINQGDLTLEIGTNVEYAKFVNDGHWNDHRFVPGVWGNNNKFYYIPGEKTGIALRSKYVEGKHYWESGLKIIEKMIPGFLENKMQDWLNKYFE